jgi:hypothetical protein
MGRAPTPGVNDGVGSAQHANFTMIAPFSVREVFAFPNSYTLFFVRR